jgi:hypothetical protein
MGRIADRPYRRLAYGLLVRIAWALGLGAAAVGLYGVWDPLEPDDQVPLAIACAVSMTGFVGVARRSIMRAPASLPPERSTPPEPVRDETLELVKVGMLIDYTPVDPYLEERLRRYVA